jgi:hypothetical protein
MQRFDAGEDRSPDGAQRNPGQALSGETVPDFAALHPGYSRRYAARVAAS